MEVGEKDRVAGCVGVVDDTPALAAVVEEGLERSRVLLRVEDADDGLDAAQEEEPVRKDGLADDEGVVVALRTPEGCMASSGVEGHDEDGRGLLTEEQGEYGE